MINALLVRWADGWTEVVDAVSVAANGRREDFLSMGNAASIEEATRAAEAALARFAVTAERITAAVEPAGGDEPYVDFGVGDTVTVPSAAGASVSRRVVGITVGEDEEGEPVFVPELA